MPRTEIYNTPKEKDTSIIEEYMETLDKLDHYLMGEMTINNLPMFQNVIKTINPQNILEIGFNRGSSALLWLMNSTVSIHSFDIVSQPTSIHILSTLYNSRFKFTQMNSFNIVENLGEELTSKFDLIIVDGDHSYQGVKTDMETALILNAKYILVDDYFWHMGKEPIRRCVRELVENRSIEIIQEYDPIEWSIEVMPDENTGQVLVRNLNYYEEI